MTTGTEPAEISLASLARTLLRHRRVVLACALGCALVVGTLGLLRPRTWTSAATFMPQGRRSPAAGLSGVAAQLGINVPTTDAGQSPGFYSDLVTSRTMFGALADTTFEAAAGSGAQRTTLAELYDVGGSTPALRREGVIRTLGGKVTSVPAVKTGVVRMRVTAPAPEVAYQVARFILGRVNAFDLVTRSRRRGRNEGSWRRAWAIPARSFGLRKTPSRGFCSAIATTGTRRS